MKGKYALFDATIFQDFALELWHELAYLLLDLDGGVLRAAPYLEWYSDAALRGPETFFPYKIAIPIE